MISLVKVVIPCTFCIGNACLIGSNWVFKSEKLVNVKEDADWKEKLNKLAEELKPEKGKKDEITEIIAGNEKSKLELNDTKTFSKGNDAKEVLQKWCKNPIKGKEYTNKLCKKAEYRNWLFG